MSDSARKCDCVLGYIACPVGCQRVKLSQARMVKDAAFIIRKEHGLMHQSTARRLALALFREGLLNFYLYRNVPDGH